MYGLFSHIYLHENIETFSEYSSFLESLSVKNGMRSSFGFQLRVGICMKLIKATEDHVAVGFHRKSQISFAIESLDRNA